MSDAFIHRMADELGQLEERISLLVGFIGKANYFALAKEDQFLMETQLLAMRTYQQVLARRFERVMKSDG